MSQPNTDHSAGNPPNVTARYELRLLTPAFVGDAEQHGCWRTPPIKALLRQWWRVVWAADNGFPDDIQRMRHEEGVLFGHAWLENDRVDNGTPVRGRRSAVRIRLEAPDRNQAGWTEGHQRGVGPLPTGLDTNYAWFGLVDTGTKEALRTGIKPGDAEGRRVLKLAWTEREDDRMHTVLRLIRNFGQIGSRSRGGWGALHIDDVDPLAPAELGRFARPLPDCLAGEWPASFAIDDGGLMLWKSRQTFSDWPKLMDFVARRRKEVRKPLNIAPGMDLRAVLGSAKDGDRLANPLRWRPVLEADGTLRLQIFAMPWRITGHIESIQLSDSQLARAWQAVAQTLDRHADLERIAG